MRQSSLTGPARLLAELPEFAPPPDLWARILKRQRVAQQRRRFAVGGMLAAASVLLALVVQMQVRVDNVDPGLTALQAQSHRLEARLEALDLGVVRPSTEIPADLRSIEQALQRAYDRGASSKELAGLWRQRNQLLDTLIASREPGTLVTRI